MPGIVYGSMEEFLRQNPKAKVTRNSNPTIDDVKFELSAVAELNSVQEMEQKIEEITKKYVS